MCSTGIAVCDRLECKCWSGLINALINHFKQPSHNCHWLQQNEAWLQVGQLKSLSYSQKPRPLFKRPFLNLVLRRGPNSYSSRSVITERLREAYKFGFKILFRSRGFKNQYWAKGERQTPGEHYTSWRDEARKAFKYGLTSITLLDLGGGAQEFLFIFRPNWSPQGWEKLSLRPGPPLLLGPGWVSPLLYLKIWKHHWISRYQKEDNLGDFS